MNPQPVSLADELRKLEARGKVGWMDSTDFSCELGHALGGNKIFPDAEDCAKNHPCVAEPDPHWPCKAQRVIVFDADELSALLAQHAVAEPQVAGELVERITDYLAKGGLFNPEMMEHDKVRELLIACRQQLFVAAHAAEQPKLTQENLRESYEWALQQDHRTHPSLFQTMADRLNSLLTSLVAPPPQELTCIGCGWPMPSCKCKPSTSFDYVPNAVHAPPAPPSQERASDEQLAEEWREAHLVHRKLLPAIVELIAETRATAAKLAREEALEELHGRIAIRFAAREPSSGAWAYQASVAKEAYLAALAAQPSPQTKENVK